MKSELECICVAFLVFLIFAESTKSVTYKDRYEVLDIGASKGGSAAAIADILKINKTTDVLGIDLSATKVEECISHGVTCIQQDILNWHQPPKVKGVTSFHVYEHLPTMAVAKAIWNASTSISEYFNYFRGPSFDDEVYLRKLKFHRYYENWHGHTLHLNSSNLLDLIRASDKKYYSYVILQGIPIANSSSTAIQAHGSKRDLHFHDAIKHIHKKFVKYDIPIYQEMRALVLHKAPLGYKVDKVWHEILDWMRKSHGVVSYCAVEGMTKNQASNETSNDCVARMSCIMEPHLCKK